MQKHRESDTFFLRRKKISNLVFRKKGGAIVGRAHLGAAEADNNLFMG
jgi:hypothetical protein